MTALRSAGARIAAGILISAGLGFSQGPPCSISVFGTPVPTVSTCFPGLTLGPTLAGSLYEFKLLDPTSSPISDISVGVFNQDGTSAVTSVPTIGPGTTQVVTMTNLSSIVTPVIFSQNPAALCSLAPTFATPATLGCNTVTLTVPNNQIGIITMPAIPDFNQTFTGPAGSLFGGQVGSQKPLTARDFANPGSIHLDDPVILVTNFCPSPF